MSKIFKSLLVVGAMVTGVFASAKEKEVPVKEKSSVKTEVKTDSEIKQQGGCFDFNDSCGGSWRVCHSGVSTVDLLDFLWNWDGGCGN